MPVGDAACRLWNGEQIHGAMGGDAFSQVVEVKQDVMKTSLFLSCIPPSHNLFFLVDTDLQGTAARLGGREQRAAASRDFKVTKPVRFSRFLIKAEINY
jgi:hypothetical protein